MLLLILAFRMLAEDDQAEGKTIWLLTPCGSAVCGALFGLSGRGASLSDERVGDIATMSTEAPQRTPSGSNGGLGGRSRGP